MVKSKSQAEIVPLNRELSTPISSALPGGLFVWDLLQQHRKHRETVRIMTKNEIDSVITQISHEEFMSFFVPSKDGINGIDEAQVVQRIIADNKIDKTLTNSMLPCILQHSLSLRLPLNNSETNVNLLPLDSGLDQKRARGSNAKSTALVASGSKQASTGGKGDQVFEIIENSGNFEDEILYPWKEEG